MKNRDVQRETRRGGTKRECGREREERMNRNRTEGGNDVGIET
jgi:hypothetical protein